MTWLAWLPAGALAAGAAAFAVQAWALAAARRAGAAAAAGPGVEAGAETGGEAETGTGAGAGDEASETLARGQPQGRPMRGPPPWLHVGLHLATAALAASTFLALLWCFLAGRVDVENVFLYTHSSLAARWKVAGSWAGREGSLALWTAWLAIVSAGLAVSHGRQARQAKRQEGEAMARAKAWTRLALGGLLLLFLAATLRQGTFDATPAFFLEGRPDGAGLNPTLRSPYMLIHPPLMFLAYSLTAVPAAAAWSHWISGTGKWSAVAGDWSRWNWLLYTFAMGLGGLWAYYTLGFGGYWAWDPVELANLLPWLALTLYLHAQLHHARYGAYAVAGPFLAILPLALTIFSTISTRSGLWVSVHAFTDPTNAFNPDAPGRFMDILGVEPSLAFYAGLFLALLLASLGLWMRRLAIESGTARRLSRGALALAVGAAAYALLAPAAALSVLFEGASKIAAGHTGWGLAALGFLACVGAAAPALLAPGANAKGPAAQATPLRLGLRPLGYLAVLVLGSGLLAYFLFHNAAANGWSTAFYEARLPWLASPALAGILLLQTFHLGKRKAFTLLAAAAGAAALAGALWGAGAFLLAFAAAAVAAGLARVRRAAAHAAALPARRRLGATLLGAAALLDALFWLNPPSRVGLPGAWVATGWPVQFVLGGAALALVWASHALLAGAPGAARRAGWLFAAAGALAGFWVALPLAAAGWLAWRGAPTPTPAPAAAGGAPGGPARAAAQAAARARMRLAALHGLHLAVTLALAGYAVSTYWKEEGRVELRPGEPQAFASFDVAWVATQAEADAQPPGSPYAGQVAPVLAVRGGGLQGSVAPPLRWEPTAGAHFPLPATLRSWKGDVYASVEAVSAADGADCLPGAAVEAYQPSGRLCSAGGEGELSGAVVRLAWLPGLGVVWLALFLFVLYMAMTIWAGRARGGVD